MRVMAFGTFDLLHPGHLEYLERARALGDELLVVVARDSSVKRFKKHASYFTEKERTRMIGALRVVDRVVLGGKGNWFDVVAKYKPAVVVLGYDQKVSEKELESFLRAKGVNPKIVRLKKGLKTKKYKSSLIRKKV